MNGYLIKIDILDIIKKFCAKYDEIISKDSNEELYCRATYNKLQNVNIDEVIVQLKSSSADVKTLINEMCTSLLIKGIPAKVAVLTIECLDDIYKQLMALVSGIKILELNRFKKLYNLLFCKMKSMLLKLKQSANSEISNKLEAIKMYIIEKSQITSMSDRIIKLQQEKDAHDKIEGNPDMNANVIRGFAKEYMEIIINAANTKATKLIIDLFVRKSVEEATNTLVNGIT